MRSQKQPLWQYTHWRTSPISKIRNRFRPGRLLSRSGFPKHMESVVLHTIVAVVAESVVLHTVVAVVAESVVLHTIVAVVAESVVLHTVVAVVNI